MDHLIRKFTRAQYSIETQYSKLNESIVACVALLSRLSKEVSQSLFDDWWFETAFVRTNPPKVVGTGDVFKKMFPSCDIDALCTVVSQLNTKDIDVIYRSHHRMVYFSKRIAVLEIPSARYLSNRQRHALWYSEPKSSKNHIRQLQDGGELIPSKHRDEKSKIRLPVSAVLTEQENQREGGYYDPHTIAKMYRQCSKHSAIRAQMRAKQDEIESRDVITTQTRRRRRNIIRRFLHRVSWYFWDIKILILPCHLTLATFPSMKYHFPLY
jgi:hypothetical protein